MCYSSEELALKLAFYCELSEKKRRHFLAIEYKSLGRGSQRYLAEVFSCSRITITKGCREIEGTAIDYSRQRRKGGGAKKKK